MKLSVFKKLLDRHHHKRPIISLAQVLQNAIKAQAIVSQGRIKLI